MIRELLIRLTQRSYQMMMSNRTLAEFEIIVAFLAAYLNGHRRMTLWTVVLLVFGLIYVIFPVDVIPDVIPILGYADDLMVVRFIWNQLQKELGEFRTWREANPNENVYQRSRSE